MKTLKEKRNELLDYFYENLTSEEYQKILVAMYMSYSGSEIDELYYKTFQNN